MGLDLPLFPEESRWLGFLQPHEPSKIIFLTRELTVFGKKGVATFFPIMGQCGVVFLSLGAHPIERDPMS
jgi:hypothetical protein